MNKSLAQRVGEHTLKVISEQEAEKKKEFKTKVLESLTSILKDKGRNGSRLFTTTPNELDIDIDNILKSEDDDDVQVALCEIGFIITEYPMKNMISVPQKVPKEIQELLKVYYQAFDSFENSEKEKAKSDCTFVLEKLEKNYYKVEDVNQVTVDFISNSSSDYYRKAVKEIMNDEHFEVTIFGSQWCISIIPEEGD